MQLPRIGAIAFSLALLTVILWPIQENWQADPQDSFPLSYYPMFSKKRDSTYRMYYFVGLDAEQNRYQIPYKLAGTGGFNQVRRQIAKRARRPDRDSFTAKVAERVSERKRAPYRQMTEIRFVRGTYHLENYFLHRDTLPTEENVLASQKIER